MRRTYALVALGLAGWIVAADAQRGSAPPPVTSTPPPSRGTGGGATAGQRGGRGATPPANQNPGQARFRAGVELVELDVTVLDKDRQPVRGLTREDFTIVEDRVVQPVAAFSEVEVPQPVDPPALWMKEVTPDVSSNSATERRLFVLVMDDAMTQPNPIVTANMKTVGRTFIDRLGPGDLAAVIFTLQDRSSQDFTNDRGKLIAAVDRFSPGFGGGELFEQYPLNTLAKLSELLADVPQQRKTVVFLSPGVPINMNDLSPMTPRSQAGTAAPAGLRGMSNRAPGDPGGRAGTLLNLMDDVFRQAARGNVTIYGVNPRGLQAVNAGTESGSDMLRALSENTGGFAAIDRNQFDSDVAQIFAENSSYYLLGYRSANPTADGRFRKVDVRVNKPGVTVHTRNGYYAPKPDKPNAPAPPSPLTKAIAGLVPVSGMQMRLNVAPFAIPGKSEVALAVVMGMRQPAVARAAKVTEVVNLSVNAFDTKLNPKGQKRENATLVLKPGPEDEVRYEVLTRFDLKPGLYHLRVAAFSGSLNRSGSIFTDIDVPDFNKEPVSLSGVLVSADPALALGARQAFAAITDFLPTTQREFQGHKSSAFLRIYQAKSPAQDIELRIRMVDVNDAIAFEKSEKIPASAFGPNRSADYRFEIPVGTLKPGPYDLTFDALATKSKVTPHRDVQIFVR